MRLTTLTALVLVAATAVGCTPPGQDEPPSREEAAEVVGSYLKALENRDGEAVSDLVVPGNKADAEIAERVEVFGGREADSVTTTYAADMGGQVMHVDIVSRDPAAERETILLVAEDGDWYLALGSDPAVRTPSGVDPAGAGPEESKGD